MTESKYHLVYYGILFFAIILLSLHKRFNKFYGKFIIAFVITAISLFIGTRPEQVGTDTEIYMRWIQTVSGYSSLSLQNLGLDPLFSLLLYYLSIFGGTAFPLIAISFITNLVTYHFCKKINNNNPTLFPAQLMLLASMASFSFFNQQINVIRIGLAMGFALMFSINLLYKQKKQTFWWGVAAILSHFSTIFLIGPALLVHITNIKIKYYLIAYAVTVAVSAVGYSILDSGIFALVAFSKINTYAQGATYGYEVGFRPAFVLFNTFFLFLFLYLRRNADYRTDYYLKIYIITSIIFFLWFALPFSDRIGAFSWNILPIMLSIFLCNRYKKCSLKAASFVLLYAFICFMI